MARQVAVAPSEKYRDSHQPEPQEIAQLSGGIPHNRIDQENTLEIPQHIAAIAYEGKLFAEAARRTDSTQKSHAAPVGTYGSWFDI